MQTTTTAFRYVANNSHSIYGMKSHAAVRQERRPIWIYHATRRSRTTISANPAAGLRNAKNSTLHKKFANSCATHKNTIRLFTHSRTHPSETPARIYITLQTTGKSTGGGVRTDFTNPGYHTFRASPCNSPAVNPTSRQTTAGIKYNTNLFIYKKQNDKLMY